MVHDSQLALPGLAPERCDPDAETVAALARAVAADGTDVVVIRADNTSGGRVPLTDALRRGDAFAVDVDEDVVAVDVDLPEHDEGTDLLIETARLRGLVPVVCASGRSGHRHVFIRAGGNEGKQLRSLAQALGLDVRRFIRPPLSPHRAGEPVSLLEPASPAAALDALRPPPHRSPRPAPTGSQTAPGAGNVRGIAGGDGVLGAAGRAEPTERDLSAATLERLRSGDPRYATRSELVMAVMVGMVNAGKTSAWAWQAFLDPRHRAGHKIRQIADERGMGAAHVWFDRSWVEACRFVAERPPESSSADRLVDIVAVNDEADLYRWPGQAGSSSRKVLAAMVDIACGARSSVFSASDRQIAERAGLGRTATSRAVTRLAEGGWVERLRPGRGTRASTWSLCLNGERNGDLRDARSCAEATCSGGVSLAVDHDLWRHRGLGGGGWRVARAVAGTGEANAATVAETTGMNTGSVRRILNRLEASGVVERVDDGYWRIDTTADAEVVAELVGTAGAGERARTEHARQRAAYRSAISRRHARTRPDASDAPAPRSPGFDQGGVPEHPSADDAWYAHLAEVLDATTGELTVTARG